MEEATQELRTEAIQMPKDFAVVAVFLESEKIGTYSRYLHAQGNPSTFKFKALLEKRCNLPFQEREACITLRIQIILTLKPIAVCL